MGDSMKSHLLAIATLCAFVVDMTSRAEIRTVAELNPDPTARFKFKSISGPAKNDAAAKARFTIVDGTADGNGGSVDKLHDGRVPADADQPSENFFFRAGSDGGRILIDLGSAIEIGQINTYSWHPTTRGAQVYQLYGSDGPGDFNAEPKRGTAPEQCGWRLIAKVDTRPAAGESGGQYGVSISDSAGAIGRYRYLLFDISSTERAD